MKKIMPWIVLCIMGFLSGAVIAYLQSDGGKKTVTAPAVQNETATKTSALLAEAGQLKQGEVVQNAPPMPKEAGSSVGGAFSLTDHNGQAVTHQSWPGKYKLVFFGFTHCPDVCPAALDKITTALNALGTDAEKIQPLFITVDPKRDTAEVMKAYVASYHASITGLTGSEEQIKAVEDAYKVYAAKAPGGDAAYYMMDHSGYIYLMSPDDRMVKILRSSDPAEKLAETMKAGLLAP